MAQGTKQTTSEWPDNWIVGDPNSTPTVPVTEDPLLKWPAPAAPAAASQAAATPAGAPPKPSSASQPVMIRPAAPRVVAKPLTKAPAKPASPAVAPQAAAPVAAAPPAPAPAAPVEAAPQAPAPAAQAPTPTPCDEMLGVPKQEALDAQPVAEGQSLFQNPAESPLDLDLEFQLVSQANGWRPGRLLGKAGIGWILTLGICGLFLFLFAQVMNLMKDIATLPLWGQYVAYGFAGLLVLLVLGASARLSLIYLRLRTSPQIEIGALKELAARAELRREVYKRYEAARVVLKNFVKTYPMQNKVQQAALFKLGVRPEEIDLLHEAASSLCESELSSYEAWLETFETRFVSVLDAVAKRRITRYATMVGVKTAAVPSGFADTGIVLLNAYLMVGDLCKLYNLRATGMGTLAIMVRIFINAFAASQFDEWTRQYTKDATDNFFGDAMHHGGGVLAGLTKIVGARLAEGGANLFLFRRLGIATIKQLRPIRT